jgi:hypothetical protein
MWSPTCNQKKIGNYNLVGECTYLESGGAEIPAKISVKRIGIDSAGNVDGFREFLD